MSSKRHTHKLSDLDITENKQVYKTHTHLYSPISVAHEITWIYNWNKKKNLTTSNTYLADETAIWHVFLNKFVFARGHDLGKVADSKQRPLSPCCCWLLRHKLWIRKISGNFRNFIPILPEIFRNLLNNGNYFHFIISNYNHIKIKEGECSWVLTNKSWSHQAYSITFGWFLGSPKNKRRGDWGTEENTGADVTSLMQARLPRVRPRDWYNACY